MLAALRRLLSSLGLVSREAEPPLLDPTALASWYASLGPEERTAVSRELAPRVRATRTARDLREPGATASGAPITRRTLNVEQYAIAAHRNLRRSPLRWLLMPHLREVVLINHSASKFLIGPSGYITRASDLDQKVTEPPPKAVSAVTHTDTPQPGEREALQQLCRHLTHACKMQVCTASRVGPPQAPKRRDASRGAGRKHLD